METLRDQMLMDLQLSGFVGYRKLSIEIPSANFSRSLSQPNLRLHLQSIETASSIEQRLQLKRMADSIYIIASFLRGIDILDQRNT